MKYPASKGGLDSRRVRDKKRIPAATGLAGESA
jgi:hypothetical protein